MQETVRKLLGETYIQLYREEREKGFTVEVATFKARFQLQENVIGLMSKHPHEVGIIAKAYEKIKTDTTIQEKAQILYDIRNCTEEVKAKYMPMLCVG